MNEHGLRRDMIECGLLPSTGTAADATAALRALRREARDGARRRPRGPRVGPALTVLVTVVLATTAVVVSWSALAVLPIVVGLALLGSASRVTSPRGTTPDVARSAGPQQARPTFR